ncbi:hypothetical protein OD350_28710 (plasmid) [Clostridium beijerinckii]|uniref:hypothetical protein n=1 Tax=Clostridium beijerinckii TaxID=1520 RepID=UPI00222600F8|nr:hypothetical protein [Clostridium beijerinckii]UYZ39056.1 hypothetical protein OD350_28710 [Clostridium beijerinckii]
MEKKSRSREKDEPNLVWIDKPSINKENKSSAYEIGMNTWNMYNEDFNLTVREMCDILLCERKWVLNNIKDNVKHIFLNNNFRLFLNNLEKQNNLNRFDRGSYLKDYYYFSREDFFTWLKKNTKISRQAIRVNIDKFSETPNELKELKKAYYIQKDEFTKKGANEKVLAALKIKFKLDIYSLANRVGKLLLDNEVKLTKREAIAIDVTRHERLPEEFTTIKALKGDKSLELVYRSLYYYGALKYTIADSLVRYDTNYIEKSLSTSVGYAITVPYEIYLLSNKG